MGITEVIEITSHSGPQVHLFLASSDLSIASLGFETGTVAMGHAILAHCDTQAPFHFNTSEKKVIALWWVCTVQYVCVSIDTFVSADFERI